MPSPIQWLLDLLPTNPIVVRLVQGGSTRSRHLLVRSGYLAILIAILLLSLLSSAGSSLRDLAQSGSGAFAIVAFGQVALICLLTPIFMAGAIAQEANPRTWDILLTTPLNALQIVLGNLFGRLFFILALLLSSLPLFLYIQAFGGVPGRSIVLSYLVAGVSALVVAAIAVTLSVTRTAGRRAVFGFYVSVIVYLALTWLIDNRLRVPIAVGSLAEATTVMTPLNPFLALESLLQSNRYVPQDPGAGHSMILRWWLGSPIAALVWTGGLLSLLLVLFSTLRLRVIGAKVGQVPWYRRLLQRAGRTEEGRTARSPGTNPIAWRETSSRTLSTVGLLGRWGFIGIAVLATILILWLFHTGILGLPDLRATLLALVVAEVAIVVLAAINMSATAVSREREDGTLDIILTTPIQPGPYLAGKLRGLIQYLVPMLVVPVLTLGIVLIYAIARPEATTTANTSISAGTTVSVPLVGWGAVVAMLVLMPTFTAFAVMVGLQWSIRSKGTIGSVVAAVMVLAVVVGVIGLCSLAGAGIPYVGGVVSAASPFNLVVSSIFPDAAIRSTVMAGPSAINGALAVGATISAGIYVAIVLGMHASMKRSFMMTVRRLAGTR